MIKGKVSVIIPSRNEKYLKKTIEDLLEKARGEIEIIAVLDGYWPDSTEIVEDKRVNYLHFDDSFSMRNNINKGVALARGEFVMKCDAHCMFGEGYDVILKESCEENTIVVPRRYALDPENWKIEERTDDKYPIDYMVFNENLQGVPIKKKNDKEIDNLMTSQGSCWFMRKDYFEFLELMDEKTYGTFWMEMQEVGLKCWLSGGKMIVNKKTWYAHWHKTEGRGYSLPRDEQDKTRAMVNRWRTETMFSKQKYNLDWLLNKFKDEYK